MSLPLIREKVKRGAMTENKQKDLTWPSITIFPMVKYPLFERFYSSAARPSAPQAYQCKTKQQQFRSAKSIQNKNKFFVSVDVNCFSFYIFFVNFLLIMSSSLEYRDRERQRKRESRRQVSQAQRERERAAESYRKEAKLY